MSKTMKTISDLNVYKDSIFMCIIDEESEIIEESFRVTLREVN